MKSFVFLLLLLTLSLASYVPTTVPTTSGVVYGQYEGGLATFKGVPYAQPPVGALRFESPVPPVYSSNISANAFGPSCVQTTFVTYPGFAPAPYARAQTTFPIASEDCLYLNVFMPKNATISPVIKRPVIVWIHPGAYSSGHSTDDLWPRDDFVLDKDAIVISGQHRLHAFGYFNLPGLPKNVGLQDVYMMVEWAYNNAAKFGGDANNIMLYGQSGGGAKILQLLLNNGLGDKISKLGVRTAVISSAAPVTGVHEDTLAFSSVTLANALGCTNEATRVACLKAMPAEYILLVANVGIGAFVPSYGPNSQFSDKTVKLYTQGAFDHSVKIIAGHNIKEGDGFLDVLLGLQKPTPYFPVTDPGFQLAVAVYTSLLGTSPINADATDLSFAGFAGTIQLSFQNVANPSQIGNVIGYYFGWAQITGSKLWDAAAKALTDGNFACPIDTITRGATPYTKVFRYLWTHSGDSPVYPNAGASHGIEIPFLWENDAAGYFRTIHNFTTREEVFVNQWSEFLRNFANTKSPTVGGDANKWRHFELENQYVLNSTPFEGNPIGDFLFSYYKPAECSFVWDPIFTA